MSSGGLTTCTSCHLMAYHYQQWVSPEPRTDVEFTTWGSAEPLQPQPFWRQTCVFCGHNWVELDI